jgi:catechol 2,3-dioxygenase-like lactoylglutathione lyase family enzyme
MIGYATIGTRDIDRAVAFFDALLALLDARVFMEEPGKFKAWVGKDGGTGFGVLYPYDGLPAAPGNGTMLAFEVDDPAQVDALHAKALALGGTDEGAPGPRGGGFYAAYFRDLDGNKFNAYCMVPD